MYRKFAKNGVISVLLFCSMGLLITGCSRDPNVRKQKYFESGKRYMAKGKYREAAIQFSNALRIDSKFADAHYQLALCDLKLGADQNAYPELVRTTMFDPDNLQAQLDLGTLLLAGRQYPRAADRADFVLSKDPNNVDAHILKANTSAELHQLDDALSQITAAIKLDPRRSASYLTLATLEALKAPDSEQPESDFKKAIELDPKSISARLVLAGFYDRKKRYSEAEQQVQDAIKLAPKDQQARVALVQHYLGQGQKDLAEKAAKEAKAAVSSDPAGAQFLARYYLSTNDTKAAVAEYQQLTQQFPRERGIQHAYIDLLMQQGQNDAALKQVDLVLKVFSKDNQALADKGILLMKQGKASEARDVLQSVIKADAQNVIALYELGNSFKALGDMGQAESKWREATRIQPAYIPAQRALAEIALSKRDFGSLAQIAKTVQEKQPNLVDGYQMQFEVDSANNDWKSAEGDLQRSIALNPRTSIFYVQLGQLRMSQHRNADAEKALDQALEIDPQQTLALSGLVQLYFGEKQPQKALKRAEDIVTQFPQNGKAHLILSQVAVSLNNLQLAEDELAKAAKLAPEDFEVYSRLGTVQVARGEIPQAEVTYEAVVKNNPKAAEAYWLLATLQDQQKNISEAEKNYRRAIELRPDFGEAANNLAYMMLQNGGNIDQVITYAEIARRQMPNTPAVADTLGWAYYQKGTTGLAVEMLQDAVKETPNSATYHYHLGMAYSKSGDRQRAKSELEKAMQLEVVQSKKDNIRKSLASLG